MYADICIIGGGILGTALSYFLSHLNPKKSICVIEQEPGVALHASSRNTGKVHAPYLYDPHNKRIFAKAAFAGFDMWKKYAGINGLAFKEDGVIEVALDQKGEKTIQKYLQWGRANGLSEKDMKIWDKEEAKNKEPNIRCQSALFCSRDASVDYKALTESLKKDSQAAGAVFVFNAKVTGVSKKDTIHLELSNSSSIDTGFVINAAGGEAVDIARMMGMEKDYTDVHFRGEYWMAPQRYAGLTSASVYSVPEFAEYPFLDPHWIIRSDGSCQIGPNAVPVFSPYGYDMAENIREFIPKMQEMLRSGAKKMIFDGRFQSLALHEITSSISKSAMINRVRRFLPAIRPEEFTQKGFAGIRSQIINGEGRFEPDVILEKNQMSLDILNYNSPGATGVLPFCVHIIDELYDEGYLRSRDTTDQCGPWKFSEIAAAMK